LRAGRGRSRKLIEATFAPELDSLSPEARRDLLEALTVVSSWSSWDGLRRYQGLSRVRAQRVFQRTFAALLGAPGR
jgi:hypothetical protein